MSLADNSTNQSVHGCGAVRSSIIAEEVLVDSYRNLVVLKLLILEMQYGPLGTQRYQFEKPREHEQTRFPKTQSSSAAMIHGKQLNSRSHICLSHFTFSQVTNFFIFLSQISLNQRFYSFVLLN